MSKATHGSKYAIQTLANERSELFNDVMEGQIKWLSPVKGEKYREYCNRFPELDLTPREVSDFWPHAGPHWDGLAIDETHHDYLLIEAKSHISEVFGNGLRSTDEKARMQISLKLRNLATKLNAIYVKTFWEGLLYQTANRLAFLDFMNDKSKLWHNKIKLVYLIFLGDPIAQVYPLSNAAETKEAWLTALHLVEHKMLALPKRNVLSKHIMIKFVRYESLIEPK